VAVVYFDASAFVKLLVEEDGSELVAEIWDRCDAAVSSRLAYAEVRAALAASLRNSQISADDSSRVAGDWEEYWRAVRPIELTASVELAAGALAERHALRGADAVHLASVLAVALTDEVLFAVWDRRLHTGAVAEGILVVPSELTRPD
jgi:uncharacterized protein